MNNYNYSDAGGLIRVSNRAKTINNKSRYNSIPFRCYNNYNKTTLDLQCNVDIDKNSYLPDSINRHNTHYLGSRYFY